MSELLEVVETKRCVKCQEEKPITDFYPIRKTRKDGSIRFTSSCRACASVSRKAWSAKNKGYHAERYGSEYKREGRLRREYGLTVEEYQSLVEKQNGVCRICHQPFSRKLYVDHDHLTKKVRGLLCQQCNAGLGHFRDNPYFLISAVGYLQDNNSGNYSVVTDEVEELCPAQTKGFLRIITDMYRIHLQKNADYSPANILGTGQVGLATRVWDKIMRLLSLVGFRLEIASSTYTAPTDPKNESIDDNLIDGANYLIIWRLLREGVWGK